MTLKQAIAIKLAYGNVWFEQTDEILKVLREAQRIIDDVALRALIEEGAL